MILVYGQKKLRRVIVFFDQEKNLHDGGKSKTMIIIKEQNAKVKPFQSVQNTDISVGDGYGDVHAGEFDAYDSHCGHGDSCGYGGPSEEHCSFCDGEHSSGLQDETWREKKNSAGKTSLRFSMLMRGSSSVTEKRRFQDRAERMASCAHFLRSESCPDGHVHKIVRASLCHDRACPTCSWIRARRLAAKTHEAMKAAGGRYLLLTLTVPNCGPGELRGTLQRLTKSFGKLMKNPRLDGVVGGHVRSVEITHNDKLDNWHPHIHALLRVEESYFRSELYIHQSEWLDLWRKAVGLPVEIVDIRAADEHSCREVAKYTTKDADLLGLSLANLREWLRAVKGIRLYSSGGCLKVNVEAIEEKLDTLDAGGAAVCPVCGAHMQIVDWEFYQREGRYRKSVCPVQWYDAAKKPQVERRRKKRRSYVSRNIKKRSEKA
jgi:plasmid rolling circle replication initiator protein Rep